MIPTSPNHSLTSALLVALTAVLILAGCGGSAGDEEVEIRHFDGLVHTTSNHAALPSVEVRVVDTGDMAISGEDGAFHIETSRVESFYEIDVAGYSFARRVSLLNVPPQTVTIFLVLHLDISRQHVTVNEATGVLLDGQEVPIEFDD